MRVNKQIARVDNSNAARRTEARVKRNANLLKMFEKGAFLLGTVASIAAAGTIDTISNSNFSPDIGIAQTVRDSLSGDTIVSERSIFSQPVYRDTSESMGFNSSGVAGRNPAIVLGETRVLASILPDSAIVLAKEAVDGILNVGMSLPVDSVNGVKLQDSLKFQVDTVIPLASSSIGAGTAIVFTRDMNGDIILTDTISPGQIVSHMVNGQNYYIQAYKIAAGYTYGSLWADIGIYTAMDTLKSGMTYTASNGLSYQYNANWTNGLSWQFTESSAGTVTRGVMPVKNTAKFITQLPSGMCRFGFADAGTHRVDIYSLKGARVGTLLVKSGDEVKLQLPAGTFVLRDAGVAANTDKIQIR